MTFSKMITALRSVKNGLNAFYILALVPLLLVAFYDIHYLSPLIFGFILLLLKRHDLFAHRGANHIQRIAGIILLLCSFIVYYALIFLIPLTLYGLTGTYIVYILGLFLTFFDFSALRKALTPIFIVVAATSISYVPAWLRQYLSPYIIPPFTSLIGTILNALQMRTIVQYPNLLTLDTPRGSLPLLIIWGCVGVYGALVFSILLVVVLSEEPVSLKTKTLWAIMGIIGILALNVIRVVIVLTIAYYYDFNVAELMIHPYLGYVLFLTWLMLFLFLFSKRQSIHFQRAALLKPKTTAE